MHQPCKYVLIRTVEIVTQWHDALCRPFVCTFVHDYILTWKCFPHYVPFLEGILSVIVTLLYWNSGFSREWRNGALPHIVVHFLPHYNDLIMSTSQITSLTIVYSTFYSGVDQRKHQSSASLAFVRGIHPAQRAGNAENVSIGWRMRHRVGSLLAHWPSEGGL